MGVLHGGGVPGAGPRQDRPWTPARPHERVVADPGQQGFARADRKEARVTQGIKAVPVAARLAGQALDLLDRELGRVAADLGQLRLARARLLVQAAGEARRAARARQLRVAGLHLGRCARAQQSPARHQ